MTGWQDCQWRAIWPNPVFIAALAFAIKGIGHHEGQTLLDNAIMFCTQPEQDYSHQPSVGDVLIWDEHATMHRDRLWNYEHPGTLNSICCSVSDAESSNLVWEN